MSLIIPKHLKGKIESKIVLISYQDSVYTTYSLEVNKEGEVIESFIIPHNKEKERNISFNLISPSVLYEDQTGIVYNFSKDKIVKIKEEPHDMFFSISDHEAVMHRADLPVIWNIRTNKEQIITKIDNYPIFYIPHTKEIITHFDNPVNNGYTRYYRVNTNKLDTRIKIEAVGEREYRDYEMKLLDTPYENREGEIAFFKNDSKEITFINATTFEEIRTIKTKIQVRDIIKIDKDKYVVFGRKERDSKRDDNYELFIMDSKGEDELMLWAQYFNKWTARLINLPNIRMIAIIYNKITMYNRNKHLILVKYDNINEVYKIIEFDINEDSPLYLFTFYLEEEREYADIIAKYLTRYVNKSLGKIVSKFLST